MYNDNDLCFGGSGADDEGGDGSDGGNDGEV